MSFACDGPAGARDANSLNFGIGLFLQPPRTLDGFENGFLAKLAREMDYKHALCGYTICFLIGRGGVATPVAESMPSCGPSKHPRGCAKC